MNARCLCEGIECEITPPTIASAHCHCRYCRQAHGAAFVTWLIVPEGQFEVTRGEDLLRWYRSSQQSRRAFCSVCGSSMLFASELSPGEIHVARALVRGEVDHEPAAHCFSDHKASWASIADDLPQLTSDSELLAHYKKIRP